MSKGSFIVDFEGEKVEVVTNRITAELPVQEYIANYRNSEYFLSLCGQCANYARRYGCPPFEYDVLKKISSFTTAYIVGVQIVPQTKDLPLASSYTFMRPVIEQLSDEMLKEEQRSGGLSFGFAGGCFLCGEMPCARLTNQPCRHPDKLRPSLEAYGFDLSRTAEQLLGIPLLWGKDNKLPDYLMLICGLFK